jgi:thymidylate synthase (FAD)
MKAELIDCMGSDLSVVNAARVSFDKESEWLPSGSGDDYPGVVFQTHYGCPVNLSADDARLISYLAKHNHWTPFAHTSISLRMQAPIPIRTQCFKHKQGLVENEESRRYVSTTPTLFVPDEFRRKPEGSIKQGSGEVHDGSDSWKWTYEKVCEIAIGTYDSMIKSGVCPEQARFVLPQGVEVNWVWTGNLYAFANFFKKRTDPHAQKEIRDLAESVGKIIGPLFPVSWDALTKENDK